MALTLRCLQDTFQKAKELEQKYVAVFIEMDGFPCEEVIINEIENADTKLYYYEQTYDENLQHKYATGIRMTGFTFANSFAEIERVYGIMK